MQSVLTAGSDQKLQRVYQSHTNLTPAGCCTCQHGLHCDIIMRDNIAQEMLRREEMLREKEAHLRAASSVAVSEAENYAKRLYEECQRELLEQLEMQETRLEKEAIRSAEQSELELSVSSAYACDVQKVLDFP